MKLALAGLTGILLLSPTFLASGEDLTVLNVEEQRIANAKLAIPHVLELLETRVNSFQSQINQAQNLTALTQLAIRHGNGLWQDAVLAFDGKQNFDDRSLYWSRLMMTKALKASTAFNALLPMQQEKLLWKFELLSRGQQDIKFNKRANKKILLTGFDPFQLDQHTNQSNPSGVTALALDDLTISNDGISGEIETLILPVRFADFDRGMIEELLTPFYRKVDMIVTVSMGRSDFDLERFPALRRSANAPDNLNVYSGGTQASPLIPFLRNKALTGPEFVEFSLPVELMRQVQTPYKVNDNRQVSTVERRLLARTLTELVGEISISGSGGGYLSNEVSYRSILLREQLNPLLAVGHIHTPSFKAFQPDASAKIVKQIKHMLTQALKGI